MSKSGLQRLCQLCAGALACALPLKLARALAPALARAIARAVVRSVERAVVRAREYISLFRNGGEFLFCYCQCTHSARPDTRPYGHMTDGLTD